MKVAIVLLTAALAFEALKYSDIVETLVKLNATCPFAELHTSEDWFGLAPSSWCPTCRTHVLLMSNASASAPQLFFSGALHGDERLGPVVVTELAVYLCTHYSTIPWVTHLLNTRRLFLVPMTNSAGYFFHSRREVVNSHRVDPNRDFPYLNSGKCLQTLTAQTVASLFEHNLVQMTLTFHGGDSVISYPWGAPNHKQKGKSTHAPDLEAFDAVARLVNEESQAELRVGTMTDTVYAVEGGMEDWAYAGGWENAVNKEHPVGHCSGFSLHNNQGLKQFVYLVETNADKDPSVYGTAAELHSNERGGLVTQFLRMSLAFIDLAEPYILVKVFPVRGGLLIQWEVKGCVEVNETYATYFLNGTEYKLQSFAGHCTKIFREQIKTDTALDLIVYAKVDQGWTRQVHPDPPVVPQTHFVSARTNSTYRIQHNNWTITGKVWHSESYTSSEPESKHLEIEDLMGRTVASVNILPENNVLKVSGHNKLASDVRLKVCRTGDLRGACEADLEFIQYLSNSTLSTAWEGSHTLQKCQWPAEVLGVGVAAYSSDLQELGAGVIEASEGRALPSAGGVCIVYSNYQVQALLRVFEEKGAIWVRGFVLSTASSVRLIQDSFQSKLDCTSPHCILQYQATTLALPVLGTRVQIEAGSKFFSCVIGVADPRYSDNLYDYLPHPEEYPEYFYGVALLVAILLFLFVLCKLSPKKRDRYAVEQFQELESVDSFEEAGHSSD